MSAASIARNRIEQARMATEQIDNGGLWAALEGLQDAGREGNGAGVFYDVSRFKRALAKAASEIAKAQKIVADTDWPSSADYDAG